jgi:hypothetical protein
MGLATSRTYRHLRRADLIALVAILVTVLQVPSIAQADCVSRLANCSTNCDQRTKLDDPQRPQCAQGCVSHYQGCARAEIIQKNTRGLKGQELLIAPQ